MRTLVGTGKLPNETFGPRIDWEVPTQTPPQFNFMTAMNCVAIPIAFVHFSVRVGTLNIEPLSALWARGNDLVPDLRYVMLFLSRLTAQAAL